MKKIILSFTLVAILAGHSSNAATTLAAGDVQILGYREDDPDALLFVLWKNIDASTVISFTDNALTSATTAALTEGVINWTSGTSFSAGTVIRLSGLGASSSLNGASQGILSGSAPSLAATSTGDSIIAYQGTLNDVSQVNLYAMDFESAAGAATNLGFTPSGLTAGSTAIFYTTTSGTSNDNAYYSGTRSFTAGVDAAANVASAKTSILNTANWTKSTDGSAAGFLLPYGAGFSTSSFMINSYYQWNAGVGAWNTTSANWLLNGSGTATSFVSGGDASINNGGTLTVQAEGISAGTVNISGTVATVISGGSLTATTINKSGSGTLELGNANNVGTFIVNDASVSGAGSVDASGGIAVGVTTNSQTISVGLGGAGSLTKAGAGELILSGAKTYTGNTVVGGGTLTTGGANVLSDSTAVTIYDLATLKLGGNETIGALRSTNSGALINLQSFTLTSTPGAGVIATNTATITGTGGIVKNGTGQMYLNNANNTYSGGFTLNSGEVAYTASGTAGVSSVLGTGTLSLNGGTIRSSAASSGRTIYNNVALNGNVQFGDTFSALSSMTVSTNVAGNATTLLGNSTISTYSVTEWQQGISGDFRLTKDGGGATANNFLSLRGSNNIAGVTVNSGLLGYRNRYALGTGTLILADGVAVGQDGAILNTATADRDADRTVANNISILGSATFGVSSSASFFSGNVDLNGATRTLTLGNATTFFGSITNGGLSIQRQDTDLTSTKVLFLSGSNSYAGGTTMNGVAGRTNNATISLGNNNALGTGDLTFAGGGTNIMRSVTLSTADQNRTITNNIAINSGVTVNVDTITNLVTVVSGAAVTNTVSVNMALNGVISGGGALIKTNVNTLTLGGANTYAGGTTVNGGALVVNGSVGAVTVNTGGSLGGTGTVGAVTLTSGSFLKPGNSPGLLTAASSSWAGGSTYNWEINNATGTAGTGWDLFSVTGALDISALSSSSKMNLVLESLSLANYSTSTSFSWVFAQAGSLLGTGLDDDGTDVTDLFNINTTAFNGGSAANLPNGGFQVVTGTEGGLRTLNLLAVPEPSTGALLAFGLGGLVVTRLLRRKQS